MREFASLCLTVADCLYLREAIRPYPTTSESIPPTALQEFCRRLYLALHWLESDPRQTEVNFPVGETDIFVINQYLSVEDNDRARSLLHQTRQAFYETDSGKPSITIASDEEMKRLLSGVTLDEGEVDAGGN